MLNDVNPNYAGERDPVCGMKVKEIMKAPTTVYKGKTYYFCTDLCRIPFEHEPGRFVKDDSGGENKHHSPSH